MPRSSSATTCPSGCRLTGPAIIEEPDSTTYVPPGFDVEVHPTWCLVMQATEEAR